MWTAIGLTCGFVCLIVAVIAMASKSGSRAAQLDSLKAEIKKTAEERARANKIITGVANLPVDDVRRRLQDTRHK